MNINATVLGYGVFSYMIFSLLFVFVSYHLLKNKRQSAKSDAILIMLLCLLPPLQFIVLLIMYLKSVMGRKVTL